MVPTEIVDVILGFLHSDKEYSTLEECSAVFPQLVERHLYSRITFNWNRSHRTDPNDGNYLVDPTKISHLLIDRPHVANYVRSVRIFVAPEEPELPVISSNLSVLSRLESITLQGRSNASLPWPTLDPGFRTALRSSIRLPSIKEIEISNIHAFPVSTLNGCCNLQLLRLFGRCVLDDVDEALSMPHLRSLGVDIRDNLITPRIASWIRNGTLHSLSLRMYSLMDFPHFRALLEACSATLVSLELDHKSYVNHEYSAHPIFPGLQLPLLKELDIQSFYVLDPNFGYSSILPLASLLLPIPITCPIRLRLHLQLCIRNPVDLQVPDWSDVAAFIALPFFLHPIEIYLYITSNGLAECVDVVASLERNSDLKRLLETGKLIARHRHR